MQDLSLHILDVAENGVTAGATLVKVTVLEDLEADRLTVEICDNGPGMSPEFVAKVLDPFVTTRTTRKVGLGLSLFQQSAQAAEGDLEIDSSPGVGTTVTVSMRHSHIDRKPMGNLAETYVTLIQGNPAVDFVFVHRRNGSEYCLDTRELRAELEDVPLDNPAVIGLIRENLVNGLHEGAAHE
jgi:hypothetical protein